ncbi:tetratricopeptide repeat protein [Massilia sp. LXY-6]|uniref:tetratricopeptide repeat protein n=1 Tax=Massilia sp. LXY-6 TaxID=3379823 RepID=UPI003EE0F0BC
MKKLLCVSLMLISGVVFADDLNEANKLLNAKDYGRALPMYARLAEAGNAEAQFRLGEMYWFGDGTSPDLKKAAAWFQKSATAGNKDAAESLQALKRRETRGNEIVYWMKEYKGEDLTSGKYACATPDIPVVSKTNSDIKKVADKVATWQECYNAAVANLQGLTPVLKHVPKDVVDMMTPAEIEQTQSHLDQVFASVARAMADNATAILARRDAWTNATNTYVAETNKKADEASARNKLEMMTGLRRVYESNQSLANAPTGGNPANH